VLIKKIAVRTARLLAESKKNAQRSTYIRRVLA